MNQAERILIAAKLAQSRQAKQPLVADALVDVLVIGLTIRQRLMWDALKEWGDETSEYQLGKDTGWSVKAVRNTMLSLKKLGLVGQYDNEATWYIRRNPAQEIAYNG